MDPFLEQPGYWPDFHATFVNYWREAVAEAMPAKYEAAIVEHDYLAEDELEAGTVGPDVAVTVNQPSPVTIRLPMLAGRREAHIEILHRPDRQLVTSLELLSPANKVPPGRIEYLARRQALLYETVNVVELDLVQAGERLPFARPLLPADCYYFVARADDRPNCQVYAWTLPDRLPTLPVPLLASENDTMVDLAAVFTTAYERGRFRRRLPYGGALPASLERYRAWAASLIRQASNS